MPLIGPSFFILGAVLISITAAQTTDMSTAMTLNSMSPQSENASFSMNVSTVETPAMNTTPNMTTMGPTMDVTYSMTTEMMPEVNETTKVPTTMKTMAMSTMKYIPIKTTPVPSYNPYDSTGIVILIIIIIVALLFGVACYIARRRGRRYSVDFNSRPDEANIPLSVVDPDLPIDAAPENGLQTFESVETTALEPQEPEDKAEDKEEQKAEADKSGDDAPAAESAAAAAPSAEASADKPKEDKPKEDTAEPSPPAPAEADAGEKTDDEGVVSSQTSVESLKETNENNSNNANVARKALKLTGPFWDVPLDCPV